MITVTHKFVSPKSEQTDPTIVGPNEWNAVHTASDSSGTLCSIDYAFLGIVPVGSPSLTGGIINTVTLPAGILGVNGTDSNHYIRISGGTGTAEVILITGGTYTHTAGGTLTFTPVNNHTGAFTFNTATGGMAEVEQFITSNPTGASDVLISTPQNVYAPTTIQSSMIVRGMPLAIITVVGSPASVFVISADHVTIRDFVVVGGTAISIITNSGTRSGILVENNQMTGSSISISLTSGTDIIVTKNHVSQFTYVGISTMFSVGTSRVRITENWVDSTSSTTINGGCISAWGSNTLVASNVLKIGGNQDAAIAVLNSPGNGITNVSITGNIIEIAGVEAFEAIAVGSVVGFVISKNTVITTVTPTGPAANYGIEVAQSSQGVVSDNSINLGNPSATPGIGIFLESSSLVVVSDNQISGFGSNAGSRGISLLHTDSTNPASGQLSNNIVKGNIINQTVGSGTNLCVSLDTLIAGTVANNEFIDNVIIGNITSGQISLQVANDGSATLTGTVVKGNYFFNSATAVLIAAGTLVRLIDNVMAGTVTNKYSLSVACFLQDLTSGILFAAIPANLVNGSMVYIADGTIANPVAGSGTGCILKRLNGVNVGN